MSAPEEHYGNEVGPTRYGAWIAICFLLLPVTIIFPVAFTDKRYLSLPKDGMSLQHFANLFSSDVWLGSVGQSLIIGIASAAIAVSAGTLCAIGCWRIGSRTANLVRSLMLVPIVVPTIVYALGLYRFYVDLRLLDTYTGVILAHGVTGIPYVVVVVSTALAGFDARITQAARNLGASMMQTLRWVILPNIAPAVGSAGILAFIHSWDELVVVLFIASRSIETLPRRIWDGLNEALDPTIAAVATLLILLTTLLLFLNIRVLGQRR